MVLERAYEQNLSAKGTEYTAKYFTTKSGMEQVEVKWNIGSHDD